MYETEKAVRTEMFHQDVEWQIGLEKMKVAVDPNQWALDWVADPYSDLSAIYKQIALYYNEPEKIGEIVKQIFENKLRDVAEFIVERRL